MSYLDQSRQRNPATVAAVIGAHLAIGYALLSGLAYEVIKQVNPPTIVDWIPNQPPPPPHPDNPPPKGRTTTQTNVVQPTTRTNDTLKTDPLVPTLIPSVDFGSGGSAVPAIENPPIKPSQASEAIAGTDRLRWITTEDYPSTALRENAQGVVVISATIGTDGKVRSCLVTQSSGNRLLDDTTCRLYMRRAHFTPARDADGNPTTAQRTDRFRWQIPNQ